MKILILLTVLVGSLQAGVVKESSQRVFKSTYCSELNLNNLGDPEAKLNMNWYTLLKGRINEAIRKTFAKQDAYDSHYCEKISIRKGINDRFEDVLYLEITVVILTEHEDNSTTGYPLVIYSDMFGNGIQILKEIDN